MRDFVYSEDARFEGFSTRSTCAQASCLARGWWRECRPLKTPMSSFFLMCAAWDLPLLLRSRFQFMGCNAVDVQRLQGCMPINMHHLTGSRGLGVVNLIYTGSVCSFSRHQVLTHLGKGRICTVFMISMPHQLALPGSQIAKPQSSEFRD